MGDVSAVRADSLGGGCCGWGRRQEAAADGEGQHSSVGQGQGGCCPGTPALTDMHLCACHQELGCPQSMMPSMQPCVKEGFLPLFIALPATCQTNLLAA